MFFAPNCTKDCT